MRSNRHLIRQATLLVAAALLAGGCGSGTPPEPERFTQEQLAGNYEPTRMDAIETTTGEVTDLLALGAEFELTLTADRRSSGRLFLPERARVFEEDPQDDLLVDLVGSYTILEGNQVVLFDFESDALLAPDGGWAVSRDENGHIVMSRDLGLVANDREFEITVTRP